jgi:hypothetical protein
MEKATKIMLEVTGEELGIIRSALCDKSIRTLSKAHETQKEYEEMGRTDGDKNMYFEARNKIRKLINKIDAE